MSKSESGARKEAARNFGYRAVARQYRRVVDALNRRGFSDITYNCTVSPGAALAVIGRSYHAASGNPRLVW